MRIVWLNWRDVANPEGGGSEVYLETIARGLAARSHDVTVICAAHDQAPADEIVDGVRFRRVGGKLSVYHRARRLLKTPEFADVDVVVDTHNGIPFLAPWATKAPVVVLVHHVHREQWPVVYDPIRARFGWWVESTLAPYVYRHCGYITVSKASRNELVELGVDDQRISLVPNGTVEIPQQATNPAPHPHLVVLGRLVPHKQVEHAIAAVARLRVEFPDLTLTVVGDGWWKPELIAYAQRAGVADRVIFTGHVSEDQKLTELSQAWVLALPSLKEGWGLVVMEAASCGVPTVAYEDAGGVCESVRHGDTGLLTEGNLDSFTAAIADLLRDHQLRQKLGAKARIHAADYTWTNSVDAFEGNLLAAQARGRRPSRHSAPNSR